MTGSSTSRVPAALRKLSSLLVSNRCLFENWLTSNKKHRQDNQRQTQSPEFDTLQEKKPDARCQTLADDVIETSHSVPDFICRADLTQAWCKQALARDEIRFNTDAVRIFK